MAHVKVTFVKDHPVGHKTGLELFIGKAEAERLIQSGYAVYKDSEPQQAAAEPQPETLEKPAKPKQKKK